MPKTYLRDGHTAEDIDRAIDLSDALDKRTGYGWEIEQGWDLDELSSYGVYRIESGVSVLNAPASGAATLIMTSGYIQFFIPTDFSGKYYMRIRGAEWYEFSGTALS